MRYSLIDRITELVPGERVRAVKNVSLSEEYLQDHFPKFPVLPGVFMLEALTQASAWLVRATDDFAHSMVVLKEARNVKYANFLAPGETLAVYAEIVKHEERETKLKVEGSVAGQVKVTGRLTLRRYNLADETPSRAEIDRYVTLQMRKLYAVLARPS
jgi:3-hydroxyacyl-[acyl-carrier-protein] dehydratase